jgi:hypothetical protein
MRIYITHMRNATPTSTNHRIDYERVGLPPIKGVGHQPFFCVKGCTDPTHKVGAEPPAETGDDDLVTYYHL